MKLKLDENLGGWAQALFKRAGHDVETAQSEKLSGSPDQKIFKKCCAEKRCLITLDLDFADPLRFSSRNCGGIVILRASTNITKGILEILIHECLYGFQTITMDKDLWIVEPGRIRIHAMEKD